MTDPTIIALAGGIGSGKSAAAWQMLDVLHKETEHSGAVCGFSQPLKEMVAEYVGLSLSKLDDGDYKSGPSGYRDTTVRDVLIAFGDGIRSKLPLFWIDKLAKRVRDVANCGASVIIIPDLRFEDEYTWLRQQPNAKLVYIDRPNRAPSPADNSAPERYQEELYANADVRITNSGSLLDLKDSCRSGLKKLGVYNAML